MEESLAPADGQAIETAEHHIVADVIVGGCILRTKVVRVLRQVVVHAGIKRSRAVV
jgi:hypothetical protein